MQKPHPHSTNCVPPINADPGQHMAPTIHCSQGSNKSRSFSLYKYECLVFKDHLYKRQNLFVIWSSLSFFLRSCLEHRTNWFSSQLAESTERNQSTLIVTTCYPFQRRDIANLPNKFPWKNVCTSWNTRFLLPLLLVTPKKLQKLEDALVEQMLTGLADLTGLAGLAHTVITDIF